MYEELTNGLDRDGGEERSRSQPFPSKSTSRLSTLMTNSKSWIWREDLLNHLTLLLLCCLWKLQNSHQNHVRPKQRKGRGNAKPTYLEWVTFRPFHLRDQPQSARSNIRIDPGARYCYFRHKQTFVEDMQDQIGESAEASTKPTPFRQVGFSIFHLN